MSGELRTMGEQKGSKDGPSYCIRVNLNQIS